tara:strand:- start:433 stop:1680 length:1248 start_codon:yes stop_codon:yes gene_type:complete
MNIKHHTIEDLLEILAGLHQAPKFHLESVDATIMQSIAKQTFKGTALTDRQFILMQEKLQNYRDQFTALEYNFDVAIEALRQPLRHIDRSKYIKIVSSSEINEVVNKQNALWLKIRFPFAKKTVVFIDQLPKGKAEYFHKSGSHEHYFLMNEKNIFNIIDVFKNKQFDIDPELIEHYRKLEEMKNNKENYIPGIYNFKLKNLNDKAISYMISTLGEPSQDNLALYKDRTKCYGLHHFDEIELDRSIGKLSILSQRIIDRKSKTVLVNPSKYTFAKVAESLIELNRFPLLVVLTDETPLDELVTIHQSFNGFVEDQDCTVLFRLDNENNSSFNNYIKENNLNLPLDKDTKIVYISNSKIPKTLIKSDWYGGTMLSMSSFRYNSKTKTIADEMDLVIQFDTQSSQFLRFGESGIEEL